MKKSRCFMVKTFLINVLIWSQGFALPTGIAQEQSNSDASVIIQINDPQQAFDNEVDKIREAFNRVGESTPAWATAEDAAKALQANPDRIDLKRAMVAARTDVLAESIEKLRAASDMSGNFEQTYRHYANQIDAEIADAKSALDRAEVSKTSETRFLANCLEQIIELEKHLPDLSENMVSTTSLEGNFTAEEKEALAAFDSLLETTELEVQNARNASTLEDRRIMVLAQTKLQAARDYAAIRKAISRSRQDQIVFVGIARNDLSYLKLLDAEERLAKAKARKPVDYDSRTRPPFLTGGYRFGDLDSEDNADSPSLSKIANARRIKRIENLLDNKPTESEVNK